MGSRNGWEDTRICYPQPIDSKNFQLFVHNCTPILCVLARTHTTSRAIVVCRPVPPADKIIQRLVVVTLGHFSRPVIDWVSTSTHIFCNTKCKPQRGAERNEVFRVRQILWVNLEGRIRFAGGQTNGAFALWVKVNTEETENAT